MVQYTLAHSPETIFTLPGKDSTKAREKAMDQLIEMMDAGKLPTELIDGFSPNQFIEVKEPAAANQDEDAVTQAVQVLSNLATLKLKLQDSRTEALQIRAKIDVLFTDEPVSEAEIASLKDGFKVLKSYAQSNLRYRDARAQAEDARTILDQALNPLPTERQPVAPQSLAALSVTPTEPDSSEEATRKPDAVDPKSAVDTALKPVEAAPKSTAKSTKRNAN